MSSLVSTGNCRPKLGHDCRRGCVHTADTTQLDSFVASAVCIGHKSHVAIGYNGVKQIVQTETARTLMTSADT